ncbi:hypothetical protein F2Q70_00017103 [Brassica cretica]|uniref:Uncharacterized protein n=1 Tax=Brassica cretica TaxID=69181 RepID=A0A8S9HYV6_BRACR|nr:hypothetical protein F2Q70_00017103 [Brassica cretica]
MRSMGLFLPVMDVFVVTRVIVEIADLEFLASRFPTLSAFNASVPSQLFGQFFMFVPEDSFFFFGHRIIDLRIILGRAAPCTTRMHVCVLVHRFGLTARIHIDAFDFSFLLVFHDRGSRVGAGVVSLGFCPDVFPCTLSDRFEGVTKLSLLPRTGVVPRGRTALVLAVRFSTCLAKELMTLSRSSDFFWKVENIFWTSSNTVVLKLTAVTFVAGVFSTLSSMASPSRVFWLLRSSADMSDRALVAES